MKKNGVFFLSVVDEQDVMPSKWDPYLYRTEKHPDVLGAYLSITNPSTCGSVSSCGLFRPVEYRDIPRGRYLTFALEILDEFHTKQSVRTKQALLWDMDAEPPDSPSKLPLAAENQLLFGTMRAYLGNVLVTPKAEWLGMTLPLLFPVKSEFAFLSPLDGCVYFWWAYLQSPAFLHALPIGSGGTRPRLHREALLGVPVSVPDLQTRRRLHERLEECAKQEWAVTLRRTDVLKSAHLTGYLEKDTNFGKLKRIPYEPLQVFMRKHGAI